MRARTSAEETLDRFNTREAADKYAASLEGTATHRREAACIVAALADVAPGSKVLDLPCGTGRLLPVLAGRGFVVTESDSSPHMLERAKELARAKRIELPESSFVVANVLETGFPDQSYDAVVCNRLFHHFREADVRRRALRELSRIVRGPIVASFFTTRSLDALLFRARQALRGRPATDRIPIPPGTFEQDAREAGLRVRRWLAPRPCVSKQCYAVLEKAEA